jgi:hypothetical protein
VAVVAVVAPVLQLIHQTPEDQVVAGQARVALAALRVILQALRHRKVTQAAMAMDQHFGKARAAAVRVRLVSMQLLQLQATVDRVLPTQSVARP